MKKRNEPTRTQMYNRLREMEFWVLVVGSWEFEVATKRSKGWNLVPEAEAAIAAMQVIWGYRSSLALPERELLTAAIAAYEAMPAAIRDRLESGGDAVPFLDERGRTIYKAVRSGLTFVDLIAALSAVAECVEANCEADEPIRQAFEGWQRDEVTYAELAMMRAAFLALPEAEQRRIFNGWKPLSDWPSARKVVHMAAEAGMTVRVLLLESDGETCTAGHSVIKRQTWRPAEITIREGATRQEAIAEVRSMLAWLESQWDDLTGCDEYIKEKKPQTPDPVIRKLGGKSDEAMATAAA